MKTLLFTLVFFTFLSIKITAQNEHKRAFTDNDYLYEFSILTTNNNIKLYKDTNYYWYKLNKIHTSYYDVGGKLLNGNYQKEKSKTHELLEKGFFNKGVKDRIWKYWFLNGKLKKVEYWKKGLRNGLFLKYEENGQLITKGNYKNGKKHQLWIDYKTKDTLKYKNGILVKEEDKAKKESFLKKLFKKKNKDKNKKVSSKKSKKRVKKKKKEKTSFWYRLFHKKEKNQRNSN